MTTPAGFSEFPTNEIYHPVTIGSLTTRGNLFFAPMAGYTDHLTRALGYMGGADVCFTEMISCEGLLRENKKTGELLAPYSPALFGSQTAEAQPFAAFLSAFEEKELYVQLFSSETSAVEKAAAVLKNTCRPALVDFNCGCPMPKICKYGAGAALMRSPMLIGDMVKALKSALDCPVTVKLRSGYDRESLKYPQAIEEAMKAGADGICLHPRTKDQGYSGTAAWEHIADAVEIVGGAVPVIGNGDLNSPADVVRMYEETGCDGFMFARGAIGNPEIFRLTKAYVTGGDAGNILGSIAYAVQHLKLAVAYYGEQLGTTTMRKRLAAYVKGIPGGAEFRRELVIAPDSKTMLEILASIPHM